MRQLDRADQTSVTQFVDRWEGPLHILVNNARVMALADLTRTRARLAIPGRTGAPDRLWPGGGPSEDDESAGSVLDTLSASSSNSPPALIDGFRRLDTRFTGPPSWRFSNAGR